MHFSLKIFSINCDGYYFSDYFYFCFSKIYGLSTPCYYSNLSSFFSYTPVLYQIISLFPTSTQVFLIFVTIIQMAPCYLLKYYLIAHCQISAATILYQVVLITFLICFLFKKSFSSFDLLGFKNILFKSFYNTLTNKFYYSLIYFITT